MGLVVQKFGGTSVADCEKILAAARKAVRAHQQGHKVVMVVSAMGKNTDLLNDLANQITENPPAREMDMLLSTGEQVSVALMAMAIDSLGYKAVSLTGGQIGIRTDSSHTKARIRSISTDRVQNFLDEGFIVIAAGFQGIDEDFNITTLGRGGSDTTAVALAAVLGASECEIYTDVDGVYTTDPRVLPEARICKRVSYDEMLELASLGAGVMHSRSIEFGKKFGVPIKVRSSFSDSEGSFIMTEPENPNMAVSGCAMTKDEARISLVGVPDTPGISEQIFRPLTEKKITVDMVVQNVSVDGLTSVSFTVPKEELQAATEAIEPVVKQIGAQSIETDDNVSKISVVGLAMAEQVGVANKLFAGLSKEGINLEMITTSEIKISVLVKREQSLAALRIAHNIFELHKPVTVDPPVGTPGDRPPLDAADVVSSLQDVGMENLMVHGVSLDDTQGAIAITQVPNKAGIASEIFEQVAAAGIFVDMIIQSYRNDQFANLTFTVPRDQIPAAYQTVQNFAKDHAEMQIQKLDKIAKLSVSGIGLRSHAVGSSRMFQAMAQADINIQMMNTSEVRFNFVVDWSHGEKCLEMLSNEFKDNLYLNV